MIYCGTLWWTDREQELLNVKLAEGGPVDHWIIAEATTTFRGRPRTICPPAFNAPGSWQHVVADTSGIRGDSTPRCRERNAIQRNATLEAISVTDQDVFIFCDMDELIHRTDWDRIADAALKYGYILCVMRRYYCKINLLAPNKWGSVFAASGKFIRDNNQMTVDVLRRRRNRGHKKKKIEVDGQHFGWLYPGDDTSSVTKKSRNNSKELPQGRTVGNLLQGKTPRGGILSKVEVDHTYPQSICDNMDYWSHFVA